MQAIVKEVGIIAEEERKPLIEKEWLEDKGLDTLRDNALRVILSPGSITPADQPQAVDPALPPGVHAKQPESAGDRRVIDMQH